MKRLINHITKSKILDFVKDPEVRGEIEKVAQSVDVMLDKLVGDKGSREIRLELASILDIIKEGILDDAKEERKTN